MMNKALGVLLLCMPLLSWLAFMIFEFGVEGVFIFAGGLALGAAIILCVVLGVGLLNKE
jgi:sugar phosphate permease